MTAAQPIVADLTARGFVLHPLSKPDDKGNSPGKKPLLKGWQTFSKTPDDIEKYIEEGYNIGLVCGKASGVDAIDFDIDLFKGELLNGFELDTLISGHREGRGHLLFQHRDDIFSEKHHFIGIEYFGNNKDGAGSNLVIPPSIHYSGEPYKWQNPDVPLAKIPDRLRENWLALCKKEDALHEYFKKCRHCFTKGSKKYDKTDVRSKGIWDRPDSITVHGMDGRQAILSIMGELKTQGCPDELLHMACKRFFGKDYKFNETAEALKYIKPIPPKCETLRQYLNVECDGCTWQPREPPTPFQNRPDLVAPTITDPPDFTDVGNAKRLVATYGDKIRYCHPWKSWLCWNGKFWERDNTGQIFRYAKDTAKAMLDEAESMTGEMREKMRKHGIAAKSLTKIKAMVTLAESEPDITILPNELDKDIWLVNLQNGTLNLKTGQLQEHRREDFMTKISPVAFDASATCERWLAFLNRIFEGKTGVIEYVQKITGQCLTGDASEEQLFIFWGKGANGKSTLIETLAYILGDYSKTIGIESLMKKERSSISNDIARLKGARFVSANEPEFGDHISEGKVKNLTGKDTIQARFLFQENFEFKPEYKLIISTNHKPIIKGMDHGIWRRIKLVPFNVTIPEAERDKGLDVKLQGEASGILNWLLCGCMAWQQNGLSVPQEVVEATEDFKFEMDSMSDFFQLCCIADMSATTPSKIIYSLYRIWARASDIKPVSNKAFTQMCIERGFKATHKNYGSAIQFIRIPGWGIDLHEKYITGTSEKECILELQKQLDNNIGDIIKSNVSLAEKAVHILKKEYDKFTKPDREDIDKLRRTMLTKLFLEIEEIDQIHAEKVIDDYFQVRQW